MVYRLKPPWGRRVRPCDGVHAVRRVVRDFRATGREAHRAEQEDNGRRPRKMRRLVKVARVPAGGERSVHAVAGAADAPVDAVEPKVEEQQPVCACGRRRLNRDNRRVRREPRRGHGELACVRADVHD
eukprot:3510835-Prymnesium_polylepis.1